MVDLHASNTTPALASMDRRSRPATGPLLTGFQSELGRRLRAALGAASGDNASIDAHSATIDLTGDLQEDGEAEVRIGICDWVALLSTHA